MYDILPSLSMLAAEVAVDLDNFISGGTLDHTAAERLTKSLPPLPVHEVDFTTNVVLGNAASKITTSELDSHVLVEKAFDILGSLRSAEKTQGLSKDTLKQARDFCIALSQEATRAHTVITGVLICLQLS